MSKLTLISRPYTSTITATYNGITYTGVKTLEIDAENGTVVSYSISEPQCVPKTGTITIEGDSTEEIILDYMGSVSTDTWVPAKGNETFPTHTAMLGKGGWREVYSVEERDAIESVRREAGMAVYVTKEHKLYILDADLESWAEFTSGSTNSIRKTDNFATFTPLYEGEIVQYIGETTGEYVHGYFYKSSIKRTTTVEFTPYGTTETVVTCSPADFEAFINQICESIDYRFTPEEVVRGSISFYITNPPYQYSFVIYTESGDFQLSAYTPEQLEAAGFTFNPRFEDRTEGTNARVDFTCSINQFDGYSYDQIDVQPNIEIINDTDHTDTDKALSANIGHELQIEIDNLKARGRYLSTWNSSTGLPGTQPLTIPFELKSGDYYVVSEVAEKEHIEIEQTTGDSLSDLEVDLDTFITMTDQDPTTDSTYVFLYNTDHWELNTDPVDLNDYGITFSGTPVDTDEITVSYICTKSNKKPEITWIDDLPYYNGDPSTIVETENVSVNDTYIFDGQIWTLLSSAQKEVSFSSLAGSPYDNTALGTILDSKVEDVRLNGTSVVIDKIANIDLVAADSEYHNDAVASITNVQQALDNLMNFHYYRNPSYTKFGVDKADKYDVGTLVSQPFTVSWTLNKQPATGDTETLKLNDTLLLNIMLLEDPNKWKTGTYTYTENLSSNSPINYTFKADYTDNHSSVPSGGGFTNKCSSSSSVQFMYRRYWGVTETPTLSDEQLYALSNELSNTRAQTRNFNCDVGESGGYWWVIIPAIYCNNIQFYDLNSGKNPLTLPPECISSRNIINPLGISYSVNVYRGGTRQTSNSVKIGVE